MVFKGRIDSDIRTRVFYLRHIQGLSVCKVADLCNVSFSSVLRISEEKRAKKNPRKTTISTLWRSRPRTLTDRQGRLILRCSVNLRNEAGNFSAKRIMERAGVSNSHELADKRDLGEFLFNIDIILSLTYVMAK